MNVVLYMRYSSEKQNEQSIEGQDRVCSEFCLRQGYTIVGRYIDRATSAFKDVDKRPEFQRMIKDSEKRKWDAVVVYKLDRFARNRYDSTVFKAQLRKNGVKLISATENISDSPEGIILESVLEGMAEFYSMELSQKIIRGQNESARKGLFQGGAIPLGYKVVDRKLAIDEETAPIVREAFELYAEGATIARICNIFNSKGYRTARGGRFTKQSFHAMFQNEKYKGVYEYRDVRIEDGVPVIIDADLFDRVKQKVQDNRYAPARGTAKVNYLLAQKIFCGHCGSVMIGECGRGRHGTMYHYYSCRARKSHKACDKKPVPKDAIETAVYNDVLHLFTPERIDKIADDCIVLNREYLESSSIIPSLQRELEDVERKIQNLLKLVESGVVSEALGQRLMELEEQKNGILTRKESAKREMTVLDKETVVKFLNKIADGSIRIENLKDKIFKCYVNSVTVWDINPDGDYKISIAYNVVENNTRTVIFDKTGSTLKPNAPPLGDCSNTLFLPRDNVFVHIIACRF